MDPTPGTSALQPHVLMDKDPQAYSRLGPAVYLSSDGRWGMTHYYHEKSGHENIVFAVPSGRREWTVTGDPVGLSADGSQVYVQDKKDSFALVTRDGRKSPWLSLQGQLPGALTRVESVVISPTGRFVLLCLQIDGRRPRFLFDTRDGKLLASFSDHGLRPSGVFSPDEHCLLIATGRQLSLYELPGDVPRSLGFWHRVLQFFQDKSGQLPDKWNVVPLGCSYISCVAFSPDGRSVLSLSLAGGQHTCNNKIHLWDVSTGKPLREFVLDSMDTFDWIGFLAGGRVAIAFSKYDRTDQRGAVLWDLTPGTVPRQVRQESWPVPDYEPSEHVVASAQAGAVLVYYAFKLLHLPSSWTDLAQLFPVAAPCPWCRAQVPAEASSCPECRRSFAELGLPRKPAVGTVPVAPAYQRLSASRIHTLVAALENSYGGGEEGHRDNDPGPEKWRDATTALIAAGPAVVPSVVAALVRVFERHSPRVTSSCPYIYLNCVLDGIGPTGAAALRAAAAQLPQADPAIPVCSAGAWVRDALEKRVLAWDLAAEAGKDQTPRY